MPVGRIKLAFCVHNHQPVGNFEWVFERASDRAYRPFLEVLRAHPEMKVVLHYSGSLLSWLEEHRPDILEELGRAVSAGQAELLTGGFYEPILTIIPERDAAGQIERLTEYLRERFEAEPKGLWLPERVWEPELIGVLRRADVGYTLVDDNNLAQAGISEQESLARFEVRGPDGQRLDVFPINEPLRRAIPFASPEAALEHLRRLSGEDDRLVVWADDGEKLGEWPGTHDLCYRQGWLERFFRLLADNRDWVEVVTLREAVERWPAKGPIELPAGSYEEMIEWSGGCWRNFLGRYPESNLMHRKMLLVSERVAEAEGGEKADQARDRLYRGQANDAYWHGAFGGLYLLHLRVSTYRNLLAAENALGGGGFGVREADLDGDGREEVLVEHPGLNAYFHRIGGQLIELDHRAAAANVGATLARRPERYHERLRLDDGPAYDWYPRHSLIDHFLREDASLEGFARCEYPEQGDFVNQPYDAKARVHSRGAQVVLGREGGVWVGDEFLPVTVRKEVGFSRRAPEVVVSYHIEHGADRPVRLWFACESNFVLSAGEAPGCYYRVDNADPGPALDHQGDLGEVERLALVDEALGATVELRFEGPTRVWAFPVRTLSQGLEGPMESYQGSSVTAHWRLPLGPGEVARISFSIALGRMGK